MPLPKETKIVSNITINQLTEKQYRDLQKVQMIKNDELYLIMPPEDTKDNKQDDGNLEIWDKIRMILAGTGQTINLNEQETYTNMEKGMAAQHIEGQEITWNGDTKYRNIIKFPAYLFAKDTMAHFYTNQYKMEDSFYFDIPCALFLRDGDEVEIDGAKWIHAYDVPDPVNIKLYRKVTGSKWDDTEILILEGDGEGGIGYNAVKYMYIKGANEYKTIDWVAIDDSGEIPIKTTKP